MCITQPTHEYFDTPPEPDRASTVESIVESSKRDRFPIRQSFVVVRQTDHNPPRLVRPPLAWLVLKHNLRSLILYLLLVTKASSSAKSGRHNVVMEGAVWNRAMGVEDPDTKASRTALSKSWHRLEDLDLISRGRDGRWADVTLLDESGNGNPYTRPRSAFNNLSHAFWLETPNGETEPWYLALSLPEIAMLLISISNPPEFRLSQQSGARRHGISPETIGRGIQGLRDRNVLATRTVYEKTPLTATGWTEVNLYRLLAPFEKTTVSVATGETPDPAPVKKVRARPGAKRTRP